MDEPFLPFSRPALSREAIDEVVACLESGWITTGPRTRKFEEALQTYLGAPRVLARRHAAFFLRRLYTACRMPKREACTGREARSGESKIDAGCLPQDI